MGWCGVPKRPQNTRFFQGLIKNYVESYPFGHQTPRKEKTTLNPIKISDYEQLREISARFSEGRLDRLLIVGSPGLFKTETVKKSMDDAFLYLRGRSSPISLYEQLYRGSSKPVVIDDCEVMMGDKNAQEILRDLLETCDCKTISWRTQSHLLKDKGLPTSFSTFSTCCIIANGIGKGRVWEAILSRVMFVEFEPAWEQVLGYMESWFEDKEILEYVRANQQDMGIPDGRRLLIAADMKNAELETCDWQEALQPQPTPTRETIEQERQLVECVRSLMLDPSKLPKERAKAFIAKTSMSRATYYRIQKTLIEEGVRLATPIDVQESLVGAKECGEVVPNRCNQIPEQKKNSNKIKLRLKEGAVLGNGITA